MEKFQLSIAASISLLLAAPSQVLSHDSASLQPITIQDSSLSSTSDTVEYYQVVPSFATRTDTPIHETPQSVQVVSRQFLDDISASRLDDTLDHVSGVSRQNNFGGLWDNIALRGFAGNENTGMSLLRNGFANNRGFNAPRDLANIDHIEFLKGPSSALYGNSEPGGTINLVTKKPQFKSAHTVDATAGSYDLYRTTLDSTAALTNNLAYRLNVSLEDAGSFRDHIDSQRQLIAPALTWVLNKDTLLTYDGEYLRQKAPLDRGIASINGNVNAMNYSSFIGNPSDGDITMENQTHQIGLEHHFSDDWSVRTGVVYKNNTLSGLATEIRPFTNITTDSANLRRRYRDYKSNDLSFQGDMNGKFDLAGYSHSLLIGTEVYQYTIDSLMHNLNNAVRVDNLSSTPTYTVLLNGLGAAVTNQDNTQKGVAFYAQDEIKLSDKWRVLGGLRWDDVSFESFNRLNSTTTKQQDYALSPRIGITYLIDPEWTLYTTSGKSFRPNTGTDAQGNTFEPEKSLSFEGGVKYESMNKSVGATLSLYQIVKENVLTGTDANGIYTAPAGEVRSRGIEFDISGKLTEQIRVSANYALTDAKVTEDDGGAVDFATSTIYNLTGMELSNVPRHSGGITAVWENGTSSMGKYGIGGSVRYIGERQGNVINSFTLDDYITANLFSYWHINTNMMLKVSIENITDEKYIQSSYDRSWLTPGTPRVISANIAYKF